MTRLTKTRFQLWSSDKYLWYMLFLENIQAVQFRQSIWLTNRLPKMINGNWKINQFSYLEIFAKVGLRRPWRYLKLPFFKILWVCMLLTPWQQFVPLILILVTLAFKIKIFIQFQYLWNKFQRYWNTFEKIFLVHHCMHTYTKSSAFFINLPDFF